MKSFIISLNNSGSNRKESWPLVDSTIQYVVLTLQSSKRLTNSLCSSR